MIKNSILSFSALALVSCASAQAHQINPLQTNSSVQKHFGKSASKVCGNLSDYYRQGFGTYRDGFINPSYRRGRNYSPNSYGFGYPDYRNYDRRRGYIYSGHNSADRAFSSIYRNKFRKLYRGVNEFLYVTPQSKRDRSYKMLDRCSKSYVSSRYKVFY